MGVALPSYPQVPAPEWVGRYIGLPHRMGARGPDEWDCWGLLMTVLEREAGFRIPAYEGIQWERSDRGSRRDCAAVVEAQTALLWQPVDPGNEQVFDAVVLSIAGRPLHVGVVITPGLMLHSSEGADSACERYDGAVWRHRIDGFYRFKGERR